MGKVLVSIPDALLQRVDEYAESRGETRSGLFQRLADAELKAAEERESREILELLDSISIPADGRTIEEVMHEDKESRR